MAIKHTFSSPKADGPDATLVRPSDWNADHVIGDGTMTLDAAAGVGTVNLGSLAALTLGGGAFVPTYGHTFDFGSTDDSGLELVGTMAGAAGPYLVMNHRTPSPANSDQPGVWYVYGKDSAANTQQWGKISCTVTDVTSTSEDSSWTFRLQSGGSALDALTLGPGAQVGSPTGGDKGTGTINTQSHLYYNNVQFPDPLGASTTFYVSPTGNDSTGTGTLANPFQSVLGAWSKIQNKYLVCNSQITIQLLDGTYDQNLIPNFAFLVSPISGHLAYSNISIVGNVATPANVTFNVRNGDGIYLSGPIKASVSGISFVGSGSGIFLKTDGTAGATLNFTNCEFGAGAVIQIHCGGPNEITCNGGSYTISGGASSHVFCEAGGFIDIESSSITLTGTPNFSAAFAAGYNQGAVYFANCTFTGSATGSRFNASAGFVSSSTSITDLPGDAAGTIRPGGSYGIGEKKITQIGMSYTATPFSLAPTAGQLQLFTDSNTATWGATISGGGANTVLGFYNGTNWTVMGT